MRERLRIGEVAKLLGVTPKTLRHYEKVGLLEETERTEADYRLYSVHYGALAQGFILCSEIQKIERKTRKAPKPGDGLQTHPEEDALCLATGGKTDLTLQLRASLAVDGLFRTLEPTSTIHLAADEPERMAPARAAPARR